MKIDETRNGRNTTLYKSEKQNHNLIVKIKSSCFFIEAVNSLYPVKDLN